MSNPGVSVAFLRQLKESASQISCRVYLSFVREWIAVNRMKEGNENRIEFFWEGGGGCVTCVRLRLETRES